MAAPPSGCLAAEGFRLRASAQGILAGEVAATGERPGLFGTAAVSQSWIDRIAGDDGNALVVAPRTVPLATAAPTRGAITNGTYSLQVPAGAIRFRQRQTQLNLVGGVFTQPEFAGGNLVFRVNVPLIQQSRSFGVSTPPSTLSPVPPPAAASAVGAVAQAVTAQLQAALASTLAAQNMDASGLGDIELDAAWLRKSGDWRLAAAMGVYLPTGNYVSTRGPNPGFGRFETYQPALAVSYAPAGAAAFGWSKNMTMSARVSYGTNSTNHATGYRSGDFASFEAAVLKNFGPWAAGANCVALWQTSVDKLNGAPVANMRYRNFGAGPFVSRRIGPRSVFNLQLNQTFHARNAFVSRTVTLRLSAAFD